MLSQSWRLNEAMEGGLNSSACSAGGGQENALSYARNASSDWQDCRPSSEENFQRFQRPETPYLLSEREGPDLNAASEKEKEDARRLVLVSLLPTVIAQARAASLERVASSSETLILDSANVIKVDSDEGFSSVRPAASLERPLYVHPSTSFSTFTNVSEISSPSFFGRLRSLLQFLGPGWLVAMAYVDPGNLEGDLVAGALRSPEDPFCGYRLLWLLVWATLMGFVLQRLAIRLGAFTGKDLATLCRAEFPTWMSTLIWVFTELCLLGADIQAVIGSAIALKLLLGIPLSIGIIVTLLDTFLVLFVDVLGTRKLEACFALMITLMASCFFANVRTSQPHVSEILRGLIVPSVPKGNFPFAIALIGSVVMPHNFFLQSAVVQSRTIDRSSPLTVKHIVDVYCWETFCLLAVSLFVNCAVVIAFANPLISSSANGQPLTLYNAHKALESAVGESSAIIWGLGLLAAGQCSTMACTYAGQFIMEGLLGIRITSLWLRATLTRLVSIIPLSFLLWSNQGTVEMVASTVNVLQAFHLPFVLLLLLKFTASERMMGSASVLSLRSKVICYGSGCLLVTANVILVVQQLGGVSFHVVVLLSVYFAALGYMVYRPVQAQASFNEITSSPKS